MSQLRIGLELFGTQTASRGRGIGRYVRNLALSLLSLADRSSAELIFYVEDGPPTDLPEEFPVKRLRPEPTLRDSVARRILANPDRLDGLIFLNPLELTPGFDIPARPTRGPRLAAVIYDLIPLIYQSDYLLSWKDPGQVRRYLVSLERLRGYDTLLTISDSTRTDTIRLLNVDPIKVHTIGAAGTDPRFTFSPCPDDPADIDRVRQLGITRPFVFALSASDPRKNLCGMLDAYARLPSSLRETHQLALTAGLERAQIKAVRTRATSLGLAEDELILTERIDDATLRALYRRAEVFVFPSLYEGFGLPIVEAMACGAAVIAGDNSAQPEAAGNAALLVNVDDADTLASSLTGVLTRPEMVRALRWGGPAQARRFSWASVARKTLHALHECVQNETGELAGSTSPPDAMSRVAYFLSADAPEQPPLLASLTQRYRVDLFHPPRHAPVARFQARGLGCFDARLFDRVHRLRPFDAVIVPAQKEVESLSAEVQLRTVLESDGIEGVGTTIARQGGRA
jgi:glycosyltransferase involved in cell wall biosynthesis